MHLLIFKGDQFQYCTGRGATEIVKYLNPCISSGPNQNTADGGGCSVWLPGSGCKSIVYSNLWVSISK